MMSSDVFMFLTVDKTEFRVEDTGYQFSQPSEHPQKTTLVSAAKLGTCDCDVELHWLISKVKVQVMERYSL